MSADVSGVVLVDRDSTVTARACSLGNVRQEAEIGDAALAGRGSTVDGAAEVAPRELVTGLERWVLGFALRRGAFSHNHQATLRGTDSSMSLMAWWRGRCGNRVPRSAGRPGLRPRADQTG